MGKTIRYQCGCLGKFRPRSANAFVEFGDKSVIIEKPCPVCSGKKSAEVKKSRIQRWLLNRQRKQEVALEEANHRYEAAKKSGLLKPQAKPNRKERRR